MIKIKTKHVEFKVKSINYAKSCKDYNSYFFQYSNTHTHTHTHTRTHAHTSQTVHIAPCFNDIVKTRHDKQYDIQTGCTRLCVRVCVRGWSCGFTCVCVCVCVCVWDVEVDWDRQSAVPDVVRVTSGPIIWPLTSPDGDTLRSLHQSVCVCVCVCVCVQLWKADWWGLKDVPQAIQINLNSNLLLSFVVISFVKATLHMTLRQDPGIFHSNN